MSKSPRNIQATIPLHVRSSRRRAPSQSPVRGRADNFPLNSGAPHPKTTKKSWCSPDPADSRHPPRARPSPRSTLKSKDESFHARRDKPLRRLAAVTPEARASALGANTPFSAKSGALGKALIRVCSLTSSTRCPWQFKLICSQPSARVTPCRLRYEDPAGFRDARPIDF